MIVVVMGVSGTGKTTVGRALATALGWPFVEGDDLHPPANVDKMRSRRAARRCRSRAVARAVADAHAHADRTASSPARRCARRYRDRLRVRPDVRFVLVDVPEALLAERLTARQRALHAGVALAVAAGDARAVERRAGGRWSAANRRHRRRDSRGHRPKLTARTLDDGPWGGGSGRGPARHEAGRSRGSRWRAGCTSCAHEISRRRARRVPAVAVRRCAPEEARAAPRGAGRDARRPERSRGARSTRAPTRSWRYARRPRQRRRTDAASPRRPGRSRRTTARCPLRYARRSSVTTGGTQPPNSRSSTSATAMLR